MKNDTSSLIKLWKQEVSTHIKEFVPYRTTEQLKQMAALFSPGLFYFIVFNFQNLYMEYVSPGSKDVLGIPAGELTVHRFLERLAPGEIEMMEQKEALLVDFYYNFLSPEEIPHYKTVYFLKVIDIKGNYRNLIQQMTPLTQNEAGNVIHVLDVHTDVSHLGMAKHDKVSFLNLRGGKSYFNVDPEEGVFKPENANVEPNKLSTNLTKREIEVIKLLAIGLNAEEIAEKLFVSCHTVRTHRKNILVKTECANTTEMAARCIVEGVI